MKNTLVLLGLFTVLFSCNSISQSNTKDKVTDEKGNKEKLTYFVNSDGIKFDKIYKSEDEWRKELGKMEYHVLREKGTERAFTGDLWDHKDDGIYICKACKLPLFDSKTKYRSGSGWPSYYAPVDSNYILKDTDYLLGYARTEIMCHRCEGHLGHVFNDGPKPTGLRYCINSASLDFVSREEADNLNKDKKN